MSTPIGPVTLALNVTQQIANPTAQWGNPATAVQVQNTSVFTLSVIAAAEQYVIPPFFAQTLPLVPDGTTVQVTATQTPGGTVSASTATFVYLLGGEAPPVEDGSLTAAALAAAIAGQVTTNPTVSLLLTTNQTTGTANFTVSGISSWAQGLVIVPAGLPGYPVYVTAAGQQSALFLAESVVSSLHPMFVPLFGIDTSVTLTCVGLYSSIPGTNPTQVGAMQVFETSVIPSPVVQPAHTVATQASAAAAAINVNLGNVTDAHVVKIRTMTLEASQNSGSTGPVLVGMNVAANAQVLGTTDPPSLLTGLGGGAISDRQIIQFDKTDVLIAPSASFSASPIFNISSVSFNGIVTAGIVFELW